MLYEDAKAAYGQKRMLSMINRLLCGKVGKDRVLRTNDAKDRLLRGKLILFQHVLDPSPP